MRFPCVGLLGVTMGLDFEVRLLHRLSRIKQHEGDVGWHPPLSKCALSWSMYLAKLRYLTEFWTPADGWPWMLFFHHWVIQISIKLSGIVGCNCSISSILHLVYIRYTFAICRFMPLNNKLQQLENSYLEDCCPIGFCPVLLKSSAPCEKTM